MRIIAGDIGGTKTLLQLVNVNGSQRSILAETRFPSGNYPTFEAVLTEFIGGDETPIDSACFAVAGPVVNQEARVTNLPWVIRHSELQRIFKIRRAVLLNDFYAVAAGVPLLQRSDLLSLNDQSKRDMSSPIAVLGAGTGLGEGFVVPRGAGWQVLPSEGGHADFAPLNALQRELHAYLEGRYGRVSYERVLSGNGLVNIFTFLEKKLMQPVAAVSGVPEDDLPAKISELAAQGDPVAVQTWQMFIDVYGSEAGNLALRVLARGGVYIAGGIAAKNVGQFTDGRFFEAFANKGRFRKFMQEIPLDVIINTKVGLIGAAEVAIRMGGA